MTGRRSDWALSGALAIAVHGVILGAVGRSTDPQAAVSSAPGARESGVVVLSAAGARAILGDRHAPALPELRPAASASHAPRVEVPGDPPPPMALPTPALPARRTDEAPELPRTSERREHVERLAAPRVASRPAEEGAETMLPSSTGERSGQPEARASGGGGLEDLASGSIAVRRPPLAYPEAERRRGIEGVVRVGIETGTGGEVARAWVLRGSGSRELDRAALANVRRWRFDPDAVRAGRRFRQDVRFRLR